MSDFSFRGLEIHSSRMWQQAQVEQALDFIVQTEMNAIVFNQNDIIDSVVFPDKYFSDDLMWRRWPPRNTAVKNNRTYINGVIKLAKSRDVEFYFEAKELAFPPGLLELKPDLVNTDGSLCPFNPFWTIFLHDKLEELCLVIPDFSGIIFSIGTRESMLSIAANQCNCEQCCTKSELNWYLGIFDTIYKVLNSYGKKLIIRDFSFTGDQQSIMIKAAQKCSDNVIISLKNTPRDYYPPYPQNPLIGCTKLAEWVEFDTWGQFFGIGLFPVSVVEYMKHCIQQCQSKNVKGILLRTDWECLNEGSAFSGMNLLNVYAGAIFSRDVGFDIDEVYKTWVQHGFVTGMRPGSCLVKPIIPTVPDAYISIRDFMKASWKVMEKTNYVRSLLFGESVLPPDTVQKAFDMMVHIHGRDDWDPGSSKLVETTPENIEIIFAEKEKALQEVKKLPSILKANDLGLPESFVREISDCLDLYVYFVEMMGHCTRVCFLTHMAQNTRNISDISKVSDYLPIMKEFIAKMKERIEGRNYHHHLYFMLNEGRLHSLTQNVETVLADLFQSIEGSAGK